MTILDFIREEKPCLLFKLWAKYIIEDDLLAIHSCKDDALEYFEDKLKQHLIQNDKGFSNNPPLPKLSFISDISVYIGSLFPTKFEIEEIVRMFKEGKDEFDVLQEIGVNLEILQFIKELVDNGQVCKLDRIQVDG